MYPLGDQGLMSVFVRNAGKRGRVGRLCSCEVVIDITFRDRDVLVRRIDVQGKTDCSVKIGSRRPL
jgi:hypothetical protein